VTPARPVQAANPATMPPPAVKSACPPVPTTGGAIHSVCLVCHRTYRKLADGGNGLRFSHGLCDDVRKAEYKRRYC